MRWALVTGAASGLGSATVGSLLDHGWSVFAADVNRAGVGEQSWSTHMHVTPLDLDVADSRAWISAVAQIRDAGVDALHGLVNCAGVSFRRGIEETDDADWDRVMGINVNGVFYGMRECAELLRAAGDASIVNVSSIAGMVGYFSATYGASKWAVRGLSKVAAHEWADSGIRVNSIHPGLVDTPLLHSGPDERFVEASLRSVPLGRVADPAEVAEVIRFLLEDDSRYMTGSEIVLDGGLTSNGLYRRILADAADGGSA